MEIQDRKIALELGHYTQEKARAAQEDSGTEKVKRKAVAEKSSQSGDVRGKASPVDKVRISARARDVQKARAEIDKVPDLRADKVEKIKSSLAEDKYRVADKDIADKMLKEHFLDLIL